MNKSKFYLIFAAAAAFASLCGFFFCHFQGNPAQLVSAEQVQNSPQFSASVAQDMLSLCSLSYTPDELRQELAELGFEDFEYFERSQESPAGSGIAAGVAHNEHSLIVVFRGTNKGEWYSNFNIGEAQEHSGFSTATDFALENLEEYISKQKLNTKDYTLQITGHSRGGAVANLCAKRIIDKATFKEVTAYTFASPNTTTSSSAHQSLYNSIYNIINPEDFICYVPLETWGYQRYGIDFVLPQGEIKENRELYEKMQSKFLLTTGYNHTGYQSGHKDVQNFLAAAGNLAPTIYDYYNKELTLYPNPVTLYEYMQNAASLLAGEKSASKGMLILSGSVSPAFHPITRFMMQGIRIDDINTDSSITHSAIGCAHTYETYAAWLDVLGNDYFQLHNQ